MAGYVVEGFISTIDNDPFFRGGRENYRMQIDKMLHNFFRGGRGHYRMQIDKMLHISSEEEDDITECKLTKCCTFFQRRKRRTLYRMQIDKMSACASMSSYLD